MLPSVDDHFIQFLLNIGRNALDGDIMQNIS